MTRRGRILIALALVVTMSAPLASGASAGSSPTPPPSDRYCAVAALCLADDAPVDDTLLVEIATGVLERLG